MTRKNNPQWSSGAIVKYLKWLDKIKHYFSNQWRCQNIFDVIYLSKLFSKSNKETPNNIHPILAKV